MSNATSECISKALTVINSKPSPDFCHSVQDSTTGEPCIYSLYWRGPHLVDCVSIHLQCKSPSKMALIGTRRVLWLRLTDIFIEDKPVGNSDSEFRIAFPEPTKDRVLDDDGNPAPIDALVDALNAALAVPLSV